MIWLAGLLEGEGWFAKPCPSSPGRVMIVVASTDEDVVNKVSALMGVGYWKRPPRRDNCKMQYETRLSGRRAAALMRELRPLMMSRRRAAIDAALAEHDAHRAAVQARGLARKTLA